jgi:small-conductance mechanosensitive channel
VSIRLPVAIDAPVDDACRVALEAVQAVELDEDVDLEAHVSEITETAVWLEIAGFLGAKGDVTSIASEIRKRALAALAEEELLPIQSRVAERAR